MPLPYNDNKVSKHCAQNQAVQNFPQIRENARLLPAFIFQIVKSCHLISVFRKEGTGAAANFAGSIGALYNEIAAQGTRCHKMEYLSKI
jgi:hypothetical protein